MVKLVAIPMSILAWALILTAYFALTACATVKDYATCDNARAAVAVAQKAVERVCPVGW